MPLATFKDLCLDAVDPVALAAFWGPTLGLRQVPLPDGDVRLDGPTPAHAIWVNRVPEPVTVKQRMHLDVFAASVEEVLDRGATRVEDFPRWTTLRDPEGGELCVFVREEVPGYRLYEVGLDTGPDPRPLAAWWADVLGGRAVDHDGYTSVHDMPGVPFQTIDLVPVPEPKTVKNRIHLDVTTDDVRALVSAGATVLREPDAQVSWTVLADPEGNEFCAFTG